MVLRWSDSEGNYIYTSLDRKENQRPMVTQLLTQGSLSVCVRSSVPLGCDASFPIPVVTLLLLMTQVYEFKSSLSPGVEHSIHPFLCLSLYLSTRVFAQPCPSVLFSAHISICSSACLSTHLPPTLCSSFLLPTHAITSTCLPSCSCVSIHPSFYLSVCPPPFPLSTPCPSSKHLFSGCCMSNPVSSLEIH